MQPLDVAFLAPVAAIVVGCRRRARADVGAAELPATEGADIGRHRRYPRADDQFAAPAAHLPGRVRVQHLEQVAAGQGRLRHLGRVADAEGDTLAARGRGAPFGQDVDHPVGAQVGDVGAADIADEGLFGAEVERDPAAVVDRQRHRILAGGADAVEGVEVGVGADDIGPGQAQQRIGAGVVDDVAQQRIEFDVAGAGVDLAQQDRAGVGAVMDIAAGAAGGGVCAHGDTGGAVDQVLDRDDDAGGGIGDQVGVLAEVVGQQGDAAAAGDIAVADQAAQGGDAEVADGGVLAHGAEGDRAGVGVDCQAAGAVDGAAGEPHRAGPGAGVDADVGGQDQVDGRAQVDAAGAGHQVAGQGGGTGAGQDHPREGRGGRADPGQRDVAGAGAQGQRGVGAERGQVDAAEVQLGQAGVGAVGGDGAAECGAARFLDDQVGQRRVCAHATEGDRAVAGVEAQAAGPVDAAVAGGGVVVERDQAAGGSAERDVAQDLDVDHLAEVDAGLARGDDGGRAVLVAERHHAAGADRQRPDRIAAAGAHRSELDQPAAGVDRQAEGADDVAVGGKGHRAVGAAGIDGDVLGVEFDRRRTQQVDLVDRGDVAAQEGGAGADHGQRGQPGVDADRAQGGVAAAGVHRQCARAVDRQGRSGEAEAVDGEAAAGDRQGVRSTQVERAAERDAAARADRAAGHRQPAGAVDIAAQQRNRVAVGVEAQAVGQHQGGRLGQVQFAVDVEIVGQRGGGPGGQAESAAGRVDRAQRQVAGAGVEGGIGLDQQAGAGEIDAGASGDVAGQAEHAGVGGGGERIGRDRGQGQAAAGADGEIGVDTGQVVDWRRAEVDRAVADGGVEQDRGRAEPDRTGAAEVDAADLAGADVAEQFGRAAADGDRVDLAPAGLADVAEADRAAGGDHRQGRVVARGVADDVDAGQVHHLRAGVEAGIAVEHHLARDQGEGVVRTHPQRHRVGVGAEIDRAGVARVQGQAAVVADHRGLDGNGVGDRGDQVVGHLGAAADEVDVGGVERQVEDVGGEGRVVQAVDAEVAGGGQQQALGADVADLGAAQQQVEAGGDRAQADAVVGVLQHRHLAAAGAHRAGDFEPGRAQADVAVLGAGSVDGEVLAADLVERDRSGIGDAV